MDIIGNWNLLNERMQEEKPELIAQLMAIHMGAFDDLRRGGNSVQLGGKPVSQAILEMDANERLELAGNLGRALIDAGSAADLFNKTFTIKQADIFPNCIFIAAAAILENLDGGPLFSEDNKMNLSLKYETTEGSGDPFGKLVPLFGKCYPWVSVTTETQGVAAVKIPDKFITADEATVLLEADMVSRIDVMRTAFGGTLKKGTIKTGDTLTVTDGSGKVLCDEGVVRIMASGGNVIQQAETGQHIDEMLLTVEIPKGTYNGIRLVGTKAAEPAASNGGNDNNNDNNKEKKKGFFAKLFG